MIVSRTTFLGLALLFSGVSSAVLSPRGPHSCSGLQLPTFPNADFAIISTTTDEKLNFTVPATLPFLPVDVPGLNLCEVKVTLAHPGANDSVLVQVWLPLAGWNGRFVGLGGSGWVAGIGALSLAPFVSQGFAAATTDAGLSGDPTSPAAWALKDNGKVNTELLTNFASRSVHDLAVVGKAVTAAFYGKQANHTYWNGCSTGGRQGLVAAQKYPDDFDGILAGAPAIYWDKYVVAEQWPQVVMKEEGYFPSNCELDTVTQAAITACDGIDGVIDGIIDDPSRCTFDPFSLVGTKISCSGESIVISRSLATIVRKIWDGPTSPSGHPLWYGLNIGAPLTSLANTTVIQGTRVGFPLFVPDPWIRYFLAKNPNFDISSITSSKLTQLFQQSSREYANIIGSSDQHLAAFRKSSGKLLVWHGQADQLIFPKDSVSYYSSVQKALGKSVNVDDFFRLFLAPGVDHCGAGTTPGAVPSDPFGALIAWVENATAPEWLDASSKRFKRKVCRYPLAAKLNAGSDPNVAESYDCV
jgi:pimeloyl-ACP methyl ester carboxylesterase